MSLSTFLKFESNDDHVIVVATYMPLRRIAIISISEIFLNENPSKLNEN